VREGSSVAKKYPEHEQKMRLAVSRRIPSGGSGMDDGAYSEDETSWEWINNSSDLVDQLRFSPPARHQQTPWDDADWTLAQTSSQVAESNAPNTSCRSHAWSALHGTPVRHHLIAQVHCLQHPSPSYMGWVTWAFQVGTEEEAGYVQSDQAGR